MDITPEQARTSLHEINAAGCKLRRAVVAAHASGHLMLWGLVWIGAFVASGIWPAKTGTAWLVGNLIGAFGSTAIGITTGRKGTVSDHAGQEGWRFFALWASMFVFAGVWIWLLRPSGNDQLAAFICTVVMFLYVVMGLWFEARFLSVLGFAVAALTVVGYAFLPNYFSYWMAATGGGSLFATGLYIQRAWK